MVSACTAASETSQPAPSLTVASQAASPAPAPESAITESAAPTIEPTESPTAPPEEPKENILIAYFTWAENTYVEDPGAIDVDATTSASVLFPGNAAKLAGRIQQEVGGYLFPIVMEEPYSSDYNECLDRAADEKAQNVRPALVNHVEDMSQYDVVFLGFSNW